MSEQPQPAPDLAGPPEPTMGPIPSAERIELIDIVRGLALFGILAANMRGFAGPAVAYFDPLLLWPSLPDRIAQAFIDTFIQGKFVTIFSFLFGLGFAVQLTRAGEKGAGFTWFYSRRLTILAMMGFFHGIYIWFGDILLPYAIIGVMLFPFKGRKDKTLVSWAVVLYFVPLMLMTMGTAASEISGRERKGPDVSPAEISRQVDLFSTGTWSEIRDQRVKDLVDDNWGFIPLMAFQLLGVFIAGTLAWRHGLFTPKPETIPKYRKVVLAGLAIGLTGNAVATGARWILDVPLHPLNWTALSIRAVQTFTIVPLSAAYVCSVIILCQNPAWHRRLAPFGAVGRTALSNYLLQSVVGTLVFNSYGLGLFGRLGPSALLPLSVFIFALQVIVSNWWLGRFRFGPVEWLWRTLTYGRVQPMIRAAA